MHAVRRGSQLLAKRSQKVVCWAVGGGPRRGSHHGAWASGAEQREEGVGKTGASWVWAHRSPWRSRANEGLT